MILKKFFYLSGVIIIILFFSGCSLNGKTDGGVYKSIDGGKTFEQEVTIDENNSIARADILNIEIDPDQQDTVFIGTQRDGIFRTTNGGESWVRDENDFTNVMSIKRIPGTQTMYIAAQVGSRGKVLKTEDGGDNWEEIYTEKTDGSLVGTIAFDYNNPNIIYIGNSKGGIFKSEDGGNTWKTLLWADSGVRVIVVNKINTSIVYFGTSNTGALISRDGGSDFEEIRSSGQIFNIVVHPSQENIVYLSDKEGLLKSNDYGSNWEVLNTLVKPEEVASRGLAINPRNGEEIFYTSGKAFYKSINGGDTWKTVQFDITRSIREIQVDPHDSNIIYLGTGTGGSSFNLFPS